jgi:2-keto-3-deoxy-6-phosphogluconate aldolase
MEDLSPEISLPLRKKYLEVPKSIKHATGIRIHGKLIRSIIFTTDVVAIRNNDADAIMAVYPFTPQPVITQSITFVADKPVMMGVGGGTTQGKKVVNLALHAEFQGALAVVLNAPTCDETVREVAQTIDIPIIITALNSDVGSRIESGAHVVNVSASSQTPQVVREIRKMFPDLPIIATGGPTEESVLETIQAGANAITYTPPTIADMMKEMMYKYRNTNPKGWL